MKAYLVIKTCIFDRLSTVYICHISLNVSSVIVSALNHITCRGTFEVFQKCFEWTIIFGSFLKKDFFTKHG